jgi:hypothetical protein
MVALSLFVYLIAAYALLPGLWRWHYRRHPSLANVPGVARTANGIPGDPLNVALVGTEAEVAHIMLAAEWYPADPITFRSSLKIAAASVLRRPYDDAPVSNLYLWNRKQDLAYQQPVGNDPRKRHHVRFWRGEKLEPDGRSLWVGSATYDIKVGLSHTTGQVTHHIDADVDAERDHLFRTLERTGDLVEVYTETGFHQKRTGRNGGGDPWHTDGDLRVGLIGTAPGNTMSP